MEKQQDSESNLRGGLKTRCVNLDWLEVFCFEPIQVRHDADYFRSKNYLVEERDYGTRVYNQMFTLLGSDGYPLLEVRREPKSSQTQGGLLPFNACHIRLTNRTCYYDDAAQQLATFMAQHGYMFQRISRVDVCYDFERFDSGDYPAKFLRRYLENVYAKINQSKIHNHGEDTWDARRWDSISWGNEKSQVNTKLYNKSRQLREVKDKPYIKQAWFLCGLVDDPVKCTRILKDGTIHTPDIWRVEFSVRSSVKNWFTIEEDGQLKKKRSIPNTLAMWSGREQLWVMFSSLARHYFHFKYYQDGIRKDRLEDKTLFHFQPNETFYHVEHVSSPSDRNKDLERLVRALNLFTQQYPASETNNAVKVITTAIEKINKTRFLENPYSHVQLKALQQALAYRLETHSIDPAVLINTLEKQLQDPLNHPF